MGFGTVAAQIIFFVAVVMVASALVIVVNDQMRENADAFRSQSNQLSNQLQSEVIIMSSSYNSSSEEVTIYAKNEGNTKLELDATDVFIDGIRIERTQRDISVESDTDVGNSLIWDPGEVVEITFTRSLGASIHPIRIVADYGAADQDTLSP